MVANGWPAMPLSELYEFGSGLSKPRSEFGFGHGFLSFKDVFENYFVPDRLTQLVNSTEKERQVCSLRRGDVFLTRTSETMDELGMSCVALKDYDGATFNGFTKRLRPKSSNKVVPEYAAYYFRSPKFRRDVTAMSSLSTRASLNNEMLSRLTIIVPPKEIQESIGSTLKSLDDKIELNRRMNATLEAMARAIFQSWFVDFDPVRTKLDGREPAGLDSVTAARFPSEFENSELGLIPKGWRVMRLPEAIEVNPRRKLVPGTVAPYLDMKNMPTQGHCPAKVILREFASGTKFRNGDTLLARITPCLENGKTAFVDFLGDGKIGWGSTEYILFSPKPPLPSQFAYLLARSDSLRAHAVQNMTGTSGRQRVPPECFDTYFLAVPSLEVAKHFGEIAGPSFEKVKSNVEQSRTLAAIRGALLPKLLSGEIELQHTHF